MKAASVAAKANLASGQCLRADLLEITLAGGTVLRYTTCDIPLKVAGNTYVTGLTIQRSSFKQKIGLEVESCDITFTPQGDAPTPILVGGVSFVQAARAGVFYGCRLLYSKLFLSSWTDTSPGAVPWFQGKYNNARPGRSSVVIQFNSDIDGLNTAMPRNILQTGCGHTLFDAGCALSKAAFTQSGTITGSPTAKVFSTSGLTGAGTYFDLGVIKFTSGPNAGLTRVIRSWSSPTVTLVLPLPSPPGVGDTFTIYPGCDKKQATCSSRFSNLAHFRGYPYVPQPETLYAGGAGADPGGADDPIIGSPSGGGMYPGSYQP